MASVSPPIATESPPTTNSVSAPPRDTSLEPVAADLQPSRLTVSNIVANDSSTRRSEELSLSNKRPRDETPASPDSLKSPRSTREYSPTKIARLGLSARISPALQLTGAAAVEEERKRREEEERRSSSGVSENPNHRALSELMSGGTLAVSRPQDAPSPAGMEEIALAATEASKALSGPVTIPQPNVSDARTDISPPPSASSAAGATEGQAVMNSPGPMDIDPRGDRSEYTPQQPDAQMDDKTATSLSYPGLMTSGSAMPAPTAPPRPSSLPHNGEHGTSSNKKHKCPYCDTEFTRHHNLKSHLLTHSQEKPYTCQDCKLRFRRLHDLKRHGKLHTGEKNHECPKCGRKFARGDALARHSKGTGGCAGRRSSMGGYGDQSDYDGARNEDDDSVMAGVVYEGNGDTSMAEDDRRRLSLPAIKPHHAAGVSETVGPNSRSYPPAGPRPGAPAVLYPPNVDRSNNAAAPVSGLVNSIAGGYFPNPNPFSRPPHFSLHEAPTSASHSHEILTSQNQGITESPKPLSPAIHDSARQRSPGLGSQYHPPQQQQAQQQQQQQYARRPSDRELHPLPPLPPPHGKFGPTTPLQHRQELTVFTAQTSTTAAATAPAHSRVSSGPSSHANSGESSANLFAQSEQGVWAYIQQLEDRVRDLNERLAHFETVSNARDARLATVESNLNHREAKIVYLELELTGLRKELADSRHHTEAAPATS